MTIIVYAVIRIFMKRQARFFKALADETRLQILWLLMGQEELCVCDIMMVLGITQSKASRHLRYLYNLGWVTDRREGLWMYYRLALPVGGARGSSSWGCWPGCWPPSPRPGPSERNWRSASGPRRHVARLIS